MKKGILKSFVIAIILLISCSKGDGDTPNPPTEPSNTTPVINAQSFTVTEALDSGGTVGEVSASDADDDPLSFAITANSGGLFTIDNSGTIKLAQNGQLDYETATTHEISVEVSDGKAQASAEITINVTDVMEGNENAAPVMNDVTFSSEENIEDTFVIGTITATDAENDPLQFSLVDPTAYNSLFELTTSGDLSVTAGNTLDYETETQYTIQVSVSDGVNEAQATITLDVINIIEVTVEIVAGSTTNANGSANGIGTDARFFLPADLVVNTDGILYVAERQNHLIRAIDANNNVTTFAGGASSQSIDGIGAAAGFNAPLGIDADASGNLYVADQVSDVIRKITQNAEVTTIVGESNEDGYIDGPIVDARFNTPRGLAVADDGTIYVVDAGNHAIRKISNDMVSTLAGNGTNGFADGQGTSATFNAPHSIAIDNVGNLYVADGSNQRIRKVTPDGVVTTIAGNGDIGLVDGPGPDAEFGSNLRGIAVDDNQNIYVSDTSNHVIRMLINNGGSYDVITLAGLAGNSGYMDGEGSDAQFSGPAGITYAGNNTLYLTEEGGNRIRKLIVE